MTAPERRAAGKAGRPPLHGSRMGKHAVTLDGVTAAHLADIGGGNVSRGVRLLVAVLIRARGLDWLKAKSLEIPDA